MTNLKLCYKYLFIILPLLLIFNCSGIATESLLLTDINSDSINISDKYWLVYEIDENLDKELIMPLVFNKAGYFNKSKIWVAEVEEKNSKKKAKFYIRLKESTVDDRYLAQGTLWERGESITILGTLIKTSSTQYELYMPTKKGYELAKNSAKLKKMKEYYSVNTDGFAPTIQFKSQAVELYSEEIIDFLNGMNLNIDLKPKYTIKAVDKEAYNDAILKLKRNK